MKKIINSLKKWLVDVSNLLKNVLVYGIIT